MSKIAAPTLSGLPTPASPGSAVSAPALRPAVEAPIDASAAAVEAPIDAVAAPVEAPIDAVAAPVEAIGQTVKPGFLRAPGPSIQPPIDAIAAQVEAPIDAVAASVQASLDAVAAPVQAVILRVRVVGGCGRRREREQQRGCQRQRCGSGHVGLLFFGCSSARLTGAQPGVRRKVAVDG
jgi:hypothetical protein